MNKQKIEIKNIKAGKKQNIVIKQLSNLYYAWVFYVIWPLASRLMTSKIMKRKYPEMQKRFEENYKIYGRCLDENGDEVVFVGPRRVINKKGDLVIDGEVIKCR